MTVNVVLDIDGVLACACYSREETVFFGNKGAVISARKTHCIFPGVIEFIKLLFQTEGIRVSFYSSAGEERNNLFVTKLLSLVSPTLKYPVRVLSNRELKGSEFWQPPNMDLSTLSCGPYQKNLLQILEDGERLENSVLIDDNPSYLARLKGRFSQVKNFLYVPSTDRGNFRTLREKCSVYEENGLRYLRCIVMVPGRAPTVEEMNKIPSLEASFLEYFVQQQAAYVERNDTWKRSKLEQQVRSRELIAIFSTQQGFEISFIHEHSQVLERRLIPVEGNELLIETLKGLCIESQTKRDMLMLDPEMYLMKDPGLVERICKIVISSGGLATKICRRANRIYYVAGLLFTALQESTQRKISLSKALFQLQFSKDGRGIYQPRFNDLPRVDSLYHFGLKKLREINPKLKFTTPHKYVKWSNPDRISSVQYKDPIFKDRAIFSREGKTFISLS